MFRNEAILVAQSIESALQVLVGFNQGPLQAGRNKFRVLNLPRAICVNIVENCVLLLTATFHKFPELLFIDRSVFVSINHLKEFAEVG